MTDMPDRICATIAGWWVSDQALPVQEGSEQYYLRSTPVREHAERMYVLLAQMRANGGVDAHSWTEIKCILATIEREEQE